VTPAEFDALPVGSIVTSRRDGDCIKLDTGWRFLADKVDGYPSEKWTTFAVTYVPKDDEVDR
jgi:hypothetical protein